MCSHLCSVSEMMINRKRYVGGETRYDVTILKSYKARMQLLSREYLWAPNLCDCPKLRVRRSYVIMGFMQRPLGPRTETHRHTHCLRQAFLAQTAWAHAEVTRIRQMLSDRDTFFAVVTKTSNSSVL